MVPVKFLFSYVFYPMDWELGCDYAFGEHNSQFSILHGYWLYVCLSVCLHACGLASLLQGSPVSAS